MLAPHVGSTNSGGVTEADERKTCVREAGGSQGAGEPGSRRHAAARRGARFPRSDARSGRARWNPSPGRADQPAPRRALRSRWFASPLTRNCSV